MASLSRKVARGASHFGFKAHWRLCASSFFAICGRSIRFLEREDGLSLIVGGGGLKMKSLGDVRAQPFKTDAKIREGQGLARRERPSP